jgi:sec-independent protein translocase protein TatA
MYHLAILGWTEGLIVVGVLVLLFGARKLPELARSMGSSITEFKKGLREESAPRSGEGRGKLPERPERSEVAAGDDAPADTRP